MLSIIDLHRLFQNFRISFLLEQIEVYPRSRNNSPIKLEFEKDRGLEIKRFVINILQCVLAKKKF